MLSVLHITDTSLLDYLALRAPGFLNATLIITSLSRMTGLGIGVHLRPWRGRLHSKLGSFTPQNRLRLGTLDCALTAIRLDLYGRRLTKCLYSRALSPTEIQRS